MYGALLMEPSAKPAKPKQTRVRRSARTMDPLQTALNGLALTAGVRYDPQHDTPEVAIKRVSQALESSALIHRTLWGVFPGTTVDPQGLTLPVALALTRGRAEIKAELLRAGAPEGRHFCVSSFACYARLRSDLVEVADGRAKLTIELFR